MVRMLPGVYISLYDLSTLPEGETNLTVGCVLKANRGPVGAATLVTSPVDFLNKFTLSGAPAPSDDTAFHTILKILKQTNMMYVSRAQNGALYGGLIVKREHEVGGIKALDKENQAIIIDGELSQPVAIGDTVRIAKPKNLIGRFTVTDVIPIPASTGVSAATQLNVREEIKEEYTYQSGDRPKLILCPQPVALNTIQLTTVTEITDIDEELDGVDNANGTRRVLVTANGDFTAKFLVGDRIRLVDNNGDTEYFVVEAANAVEGKTRVVVDTKVAEEITGGTLYRHSIANPEGFAFGSEDLFLVTGIDQGAYNGKLGISILSYSESPDEMSEENVFTISTYDMSTSTQLELPMMCSRSMDAKAFDGTGIYIEDVVNTTSQYVKVVNNTAVDGALLPCNTVVEEAEETDNGVKYIFKQAPNRLGGGYNGGEVTEADMVAALDVFADKTIPISILANGSQETKDFQKAMLEIANTRLDCIAFLNDRKVDEQATFNSVKAQNIVTYKKEELGSTTYLGTMYAPHVTVPDTFNSRNIKIGADGIAIAGWLNVLLNKGIPYAFAGPQNGLVTGCSCDWKIGDTSGEATLLNDASVNYIAFDAKVGRYYMQCQNTLQIANSSLRNLGAVFNVLDIKETFATYFKEYLQRPITNQLREEILNAGKAHMDLMVSQSRVTGYGFVDMTTEYDLSNDTLRYVLALALTPYARQIYLTMNIVNQMFDFSIMQG